MLDGPEYRPSPNYRSLCDTFFDPVEAVRLPEHPLRVRRLARWGS